MKIKIGEVEGLFRYPVKSMGGEKLVSVELGWHGLESDRRFAFRRINDRSGFPWLTGTKLPALVAFTPFRSDTSLSEPYPTHVRTPEGKDLPMFGQELSSDIGDRFGSMVEMIHLDRGIFDEASVSAITAATVSELAILAGTSPDTRRFRPNILIATSQTKPFLEDSWVGGVLTFGEDESCASIAVTNWDNRCSMINFDPDSGKGTSEILKTVVRERNNKAGIYGTVIRRGQLNVGQSIYFAPITKQK